MHNSLKTHLWFVVRISYEPPFSTKMGLTFRENIISAVFWNVNRRNQQTFNRYIIQYAQKNEDETAKVKRTPRCRTPSLMWYLVVILNNGLEHILGHAADRAAPVSRKIFKCCAGLDSVLRITFLRIIGIAARIAKIFFHFDNLLPYYVKFKSCKYFSISMGLRQAISLPTFPICFML